MRVEFLNPPDLCPTYGWTHVVCATGGKLIHVSGQVGVDAHGQIVGPDMKTQTEQAFHNLEVALKAAGATFENVIKMNLYVVGLKPEHVPVIREVRRRYVSVDTPPASTLVGVSALVHPDWLIEIDVSAIIND